MPWRAEYSSGPIFSALLKLYLTLLCKFKVTVEAENMGPVRERPYSNDKLLWSVVLRDLASSRTWPFYENKLDDNHYSNITLGYLKIINERSSNRP